MTRFWIIAIILHCGVMLGCSRDPDPAKLRFFLEATLDLHNKISKGSIWEIADIKTESESHPAGRLIRFDVTMRAMKSLYRSDYIKDELLKRGWKPLNEMLASDRRFEGFPEWIVSNARNTESNFLGHKDIFLLVLKEGETRVIQGKVLANKSGDNWQFTKLELDKLEVLDIGGEPISSDALVMGTPAADNEFDLILLGQRQALERMLDLARSQKSITDERNRTDENSKKWGEICEKRCAGTSIECVISCEREFEIRNR